MSQALVIGGGPAGLMAADVLSANGISVIVADQMPTVGRKLLMAGKSGLNLTKDEPLAAFLDRYWQLPESYRRAVEQFGPAEAKQWAIDLGQPIFSGSTGRVFPVAMKASPLLRAWIARLDRQGVDIRTRWAWRGWNADGAVFQTTKGQQVISADVTILALGGGSWRRLGSDGSWTNQFKDVAPFKPSNCGFRVNWSPYMAQYFGRPIKSTCLRAGHSSSRGEWIITSQGIEGGGVYEVSAELRDGAALEVDLLPDATLKALRNRWGRRRAKSSLTQNLRSALRLSPEKVALVQEVFQGLGRPADVDICGLVKALPLPLEGPMDIDLAISTAGGLTADAVSETLMLKERPGVFAAGEMLDWDAPTGGYLLTACLATGHYAGLNAAHWLGHLESNLA